MVEINKKPVVTPAQSLAWLGVTSAAWAHRLANMLGIIPAIINRIKKNIHDKDKVLSGLNDIEERAQKVMGIIRELRGFSRLSAGSGVGPVQVNSVIRKTLEDHYKYLEKDQSGPSFRLDLASQLPEIKADESLLPEVIRNIVDNSVSSIQSLRDLRDGIIIIRTYLVDGNVAIDISDNGKGIPSNLAEKLFEEPIHSGLSGGFGIGLIIAHTLVNSWGGIIKLTNNSIKGTTIQILLNTWKKPLKVREARRALVVDDDPNWGDAIYNLLKERINEVDLAFTIDEAIKLIEVNEYDLALLDLNLGISDNYDSTGLNIARFLRERNPGILIVMVSGYTEASNIVDAMSSGVDAFLDKLRFSSSDLDRVLDKVTLRRETEMESIRLKQLNKFMYETLSMISHELRAPLLIVQRSAEALSIGALGPLNQEQMKAVETIRTAVHREFVLLNAHLDLTRIEEGTENLYYQEYDLVELIREEINAHKNEATRKGVIIKSGLPNKRATVKIDVNRFRVALNPIMDNAIKFSPDGTTVIVEIRLATEYVEVRVSDQGPGMKPEEIDRLLDLRISETPDFTQRMRSSGLGLSMANRLIKLHKGKLWIESDGKKGTTVGFRIPFIKRENKNVKDIGH